MQQCPWGANISKLKANDQHQQAQSGLCMELGPEAIGKANAVGEGGCLAKGNPAERHHSSPQADLACWTHHPILLVTRILGSPRAGLGGLLSELHWLVHLLSSWLVSCKRVWPDPLDT